MSAAQMVYLNLSTIISADKGDFGHFHPELLWRMLKWISGSFGGGGGGGLPGASYISVARHGQEKAIAFDGSAIIGG